MEPTKEDLRPDRPGIPGKRTGDPVGGKYAFDVGKFLQLQLKNMPPIFDASKNKNEGAKPYGSTEAEKQEIQRTLKYQQIANAQAMAKRKFKKNYYK